MQDVWKATPSPQRELTGELVADWWGRQLLQNVVTVELGSNSEEFAKLADGSFTPLQGGGNTVSQTGSRYAVRLFSNPPFVQGPIATRQWNYKNVAFTWTGVNGDTRQYAYWEGHLSPANQDAKQQDSGGGPETFWDSAFTMPIKNSGFRLASWQFPYGVTLTVNYPTVGTGSPPAGIPASVTSNLGWTLNLPATSNGSGYGCASGSQIISFSNLAGETTSVSFNPLIATSGSVRPLGICQIGGVYEPINASQPAIQYGYDTLGRLVSAKDAISVQQGTSVRAPYSFFIAPGYRSERDDPLGAPYTIETMAGGATAHIVRVIDELGRITVANQDGRGRLVSRVFPEGDQEQFGYNPIDQITSLTRVAKAGFTPATYTVSATYDPVWHKLASLTDARTNTTTLTYVPTGTSGASQLQSITRPMVGGTNPVYSYQYNSSGLITLETDPIGSTTTHGYDSHGDMTTTTTGTSAVGANPALNLTTTTTYDIASGSGVGNVTAVFTPRATANSPSDPHGGVTTTQYDVMRRKTDEQVRDLTATATPIARSHWAYDLNGRLIQEQVASVLDGSGNATTWLTTTTGYTLTGQKAQVTDPVGTVTQFSYDGDDRQLCAATRMNPAAYGSLPADACTLSSPGTQGPDRITQNIYDGAGQVVQLRKALRTTLEQAYATYAYSSDGNQTDVIDANGNHAQMSYDGYNRLAAWIFPSPTGPTAFNPASVATALATAGSANTADYESYGYDPNDNRISWRKRDGSVFALSFDALDRMTTKVVPARAGLPAANARSVYYGYDLVGRQLYARFDSASGSEGVSSAYDVIGRATSRGITMGGVSRTLSYLYDADGDRTRITHPDGPYFANLYDPRDHWSHSDWWTAAGGTVPFAQVTYDPVGRRTDINRASSYTGYTYDAASRLTGQTQRFAGGTGNLNVAYGLNSAGQITNRTRDNDAFSYGGPATISSSYTPNGLNQYASAGGATLQYDPNGNLTSDGTTTYLYDDENRLVSASNGTSLLYDPLGRLWQVSGAAATTQFLYDGDQLAAEYDGSGAMSWRYMFGREDEPILADAGGALNCSGTHVLHTDHQGSIIAEADCSGNRVKVLSYDEHGLPASGNAGSRFQYTGQAWLSEVGLFYFKARIYSPVLGRFLQMDPVGYEDQLNLYAFADDDPINGSDSSGLIKKYSEYSVPQLVGTIGGTYSTTSFTINLDNPIYSASLNFSSGAISASISSGGNSISGSATNSSISGSSSIKDLGNATLAISNPVRAYESGSAADLHSRSVTGDGLDIHHAPQKHVAEQNIPGYTHANGPAIALPKAEHSLIPNIKGNISINPRSMLAVAARDLRTYTSATNSAIRTWLQNAKSSLGL